MYTLLVFLGMISMILIPVFLIIGIVRILMKKPAKKQFCIAAIALVCFIFTGIITANFLEPSKEYAEAAIATQAEREAVEKEKKEAELRKKEEKEAKLLEEKLRKEQEAEEKRKQKEAEEEAARIAAEEAEKARLAVTFEDVYREFKANEVRANEKYKGNRYRITARINGIETGGLLNMTGGATLTMEYKSGDIWAGFYAEFEKEQEEALKNVNVGDKITFEGTCGGWSYWSDCKLVAE